MSLAHRYLERPTTAADIIENQRRIQLSRHKRLPPPLPREVCNGVVGLQAYWPTTPTFTYNFFYGPQPHKPAPKAVDVVRATCEHFRVSIEDMTQHKGRPVRIARMRQVAMYMSRQVTMCSLSEIGRVLGGRDSSTVIHGAKVTAQRMETDQKLAGDVAAIRARLEA